MDVINATEANYPSDLSSRRPIPASCPRSVPIVHHTVICLTFISYSPSLKLAWLHGVNSSVAAGRYRRYIHTRFLVFCSVHSPSKRFYSRIRHWQLHLDVYRCCLCLRWISSLLLNNHFFLVLGFLSWIESSSASFLALWLLLVPYSQVPGSCMHFNVFMFVFSVHFHTSPPPPSHQPSSQLLLLPPPPPPHLPSPSLWLLSW